MRATSLALYLLTAAPLEAAAWREPPSTVSPAPATATRQALDAWLGHITGAQGAIVSPIEDPSVRKVFPEDSFYAVRFRRYPRAQLAPKPLALENLVRVDRDGSVTLVANRDALRQFLGNELPPISDMAGASCAVLASLRLAEPLYQDGEYTFQIPPRTISTIVSEGQRVASAKSEVTSGGEGGITVTLTFDASGKVANVLLGGAVRPDVRLR